MTVSEDSAETEGVCLLWGDNGATRCVLKEKEQEHHERWVARHMSDLGNVCV